MHQSNFALVGFTAKVPTYDDLESGTLFDFKANGISDEATVQEKIASGIDIVSFSGNKLLGGLQAGIIVGKKAYIDKLKQDQLARVLHVDKFTLASLEATLKSYILSQEMNIPTIQDITAKAEDIKVKAVRFIELAKEGLQQFTFSLQEDVSKVGGTMPTVALDTYVIQVE